MTTLEVQKNHGAAYLALAILAKAADDYYDLSARRVQSHSTKDEGKYSKTEIRDFFRGDFCKFILQELGSSVKGDYLFEIVKKNSKRKISNK